MIQRHHYVSCCWNRRIYWILLLCAIRDDIRRLTGVEPLSSFVSANLALPYGGGEFPVAPTARPAVPSQHTLGYEFPSPSSPARPTVSPAPAPYAPVLPPESSRPPIYPYPTTTAPPPALTIPPSPSSYAYYYTFNNQTPRPATAPPVNPSPPYYQAPASPALPPHQTGSLSSYGAYAGPPSFPNDDRCFYASPNCGVADAQPFDRKSLITLPDCQQRCLSFQTGLYICRAVVYDYINQVCDIYAITGRTLPATLVTDIGRNYYEPTGNCIENIPVAPAAGYGSGASPPAATPPATIPATVPATQPTTRPPATPAPTTSRTITSLRTVSTTTRRPSAPSGSGSVTTGCPSDKTARLVKADQYELGSSDATKLTGLSEQQCVQKCLDNQPKTCKSADYDNTAQECFISSQAATQSPDSGNQIKPSRSKAYFEKICIDGPSAEECPQVFERVPQSVLAGFAKQTIDSKTLQECIEACVMAVEIFAFRCESGMFFFEESELNCILNEETRSTSPEVFTQENADVVDYFEVRCNGPGPDNNDVQEDAVGRSGIRRLQPKGRIKPSPFSGAYNKSRRVTARNFPWSQWTPCGIFGGAQRIRYQQCGDPDIRRCISEMDFCSSRSLNDSLANSSRNNRRRLSPLSRRSPLRPASPLPRGRSRYGAAFVDQMVCRTGRCCPYRGSCRIGRINSPNGGIEWCSNPCDS